MIVQLLIIAAGIISIFISIYLKRSFPLLASALKKDISIDFFQQFSRWFLFLGIVGLPIAFLNRFYLSLGYILLLLIISTIFGITFSKKIGD